MKILLSLITLCLVWSISGCSTRSPDSNFYLLQNPMPSENLGNEIRIGLGPVTIADYLQKPQIAIRTDGSKMQFAEFERWASDLRGQIITALQYELSAQLNTADVFEYPWRRSDKIDVSLSVDIKRLDASFDESKAYLHATVTMTDKSGNSNIRSYVLTQVLADNSYDAAVTAERRLLTQMVNKITLSLR
ncbi:PqiC family protein [Kangiella sediminilitoris]|uniref:ABC-type transport auxiliary lipoprotein component domain-containing protein n=1 Tax=Kangiella sediminilitoris TaxID=1144748 RepID=A0A1B3BD44_9GAMM|nr:PqiC family protein [Kangiella sediminilitoris]AOE50647.1 hypothetical protein KS2013_1938 [Kangiella sediminilitoris]